MHSLNCIFLLQYFILKSIKAGYDHYWSNIMEWNWFFNKRCQRNIMWSTPGRFSEFINFRILLNYSSANQNASRINMKTLFSLADYHTKSSKAIFSQSLRIFQKELCDLEWPCDQKNYKKGSMIEKVQK